MARNTLEHIPLAANAVMIGSLGQANQVTTAIKAIKKNQSILLTSFFIKGNVKCEGLKISYNPESQMEKTQKRLSP